MVPFPTYMVPGYCASNLPVELLADGAPRINSVALLFLCQSFDICIFSFLRFPQAQD